MLKKMCALLLVLFAFSTAAVVDTNLTTFAYSPFPVWGLKSWVNDVNVVSKYSYAPSTVYDNGTFHQFYCSTGNATDNFFNPTQNPYLYMSYDHIRYRTSKDGYNWSAPRVVMTVNKNNDDICACDPTVVNGGDGYWYMLYGGNSEEGVVGAYLARSTLIQGPYYKYLGNGKWETELQSSAKPKFVLYKNNESAQQQTVVKKDDGFYVWFADLEKEFRFVHVEKLTDLENVDFKEIKTLRYKHTYEKDASHSFAMTFSLGDVRYNADLDIWELWCIFGHMSEGMYVSLFTSSDGVEWVWQDRNLGPYNFIHNVGVSGDKFGIVKNGWRLVSFSAPHPGTENPNTALYMTCDDMRCDSTQLGGAYGYDVYEQSKDTTRPLIGEWSMWQQLVDGTCRLDAIIYPDTGFVFPEGVKSKTLEYFTGDFDGDGISDLGAFERSTSKWYIRSSRNGEYIHNGDSYLPSLTERSEIIVGDFDGDGKTDVGMVNRGSGKWYIRSSVNNEYGINHHTPSSPNYIPWGWQWDLTAKSGYKIVVGDYDGDGIADRAVYNAPYWYIIPSMATAKNIKKDFFVANGTYIPWKWNWLGMQSSHVAVSGDFDGDGITDRAIYGMDDTKWYVLSSRLNETPLTWHWKVPIGGGDDKKQEEIWGHNFSSDLEAKPYAGDYDGDGVADLVQVNLSSGEWSIYSSMHGVTLSHKWNRLKNAKDPVILVGDFDGDGMADKAFVDRNNQHFYVISSRGKHDGVNVEIKSIKELMKEKSLKKEGSHGQEGPKPETPVSKVPPVNVSVVNRDVTVANVPNGAKVVVFDLNGKNVFDAVSNGSSVNFQLPSYGKFIVRAGAMTRMVVAK
ncbi:MAG: hypothetical protein IK012_13130 [Fibrobacter sp.]|uniref:FG-GAP-like repeat-containing protein n=1 Tax=Fibrobacter sp. TaxID=35828 RepID=UPI0025C3CB0E|nr:FG-GAP-like repeat-containing protein [Fibrobacter sp.]MBR4786175.1 hypothetical protein [Fibrobacter sp.]